MSDYLTDEEQAERLKRWWNENGNSVLGSLLVFVVGLFGWNYYGSYRDDIAQDGSKAYRAYLESEERAPEAKRVLDEFAGSSFQVLVLLDQAKEKISDNDIASAELLLSEAVEAGAGLLLTDMASIRLAKIQQQLGKSDEALRTLNKVKNEGYLAWALELKGDIHMSLGEIKSAHESYLAATSALGEEGESRPLLKIKMGNAAPFNGNYVLLENELSQAVRKAKEILGSSKDTKENMSE